MRKLLLVLTVGFFTAITYTTNYYYYLSSREDPNKYIALIDRNGSDNSILYNISYCATLHRKDNERGPGQRVVSYAFYGSMDNKRHYFQGIEENIKLVKQYYPGWTMRVYHNATPSTEAYSAMENLEKKYENLDFCNIQNISHFENLSAAFEMLWRFIPMADPTVDIFLSRDLDSKIYPREVAAVQEWLETNYTFHIMRDHPLHNAKIMGGMWGARIVNRRQLFSQLLRKIITEKTGKWHGVDQNLLSAIVWPYTDGDGIHHDSYLCTDYSLKHKFWKPFPTRREKNEFVGSSGGKISDKCPVECRGNAKWTFC